jgi:hypothetical protein
MSNPVPGPAGRPDPSADHTRSASRGGESARREPSAHEAAGRYDHPEAQLGGADAVEKTSYVVGEGAEPHGRPRGEYVARTDSGAGNVLAWIVGGLAALIALVYAIGVFT